MGTVRGIRCGLAYGENFERRCVWCGLMLLGRKLTWCGPDCQAQWRANHYWTNARQAALELHAYTCVRCTLPPLHKPDRREYGFDARVFDAALIGFEAERIRRKLEVNHIKPRLGQGYAAGCWHHQGNLEVLCHEHHVVETTFQRRERTVVEPELQLTLLAS